MRQNDNVDEWGAPEYREHLEEPSMSLREDVSATRPLNFDELRVRNQQRLPDFSHVHDNDEFDWTVNDWGVAAGGEMGEMLNLLKKLRRGEPIDVADVGREIADTITYLDFVAWKLGLDTGQEVVRKFNEVSERIGSHVRM